MTVRIFQFAAVVSMTVVSIGCATSGDFVKGAGDREAEVVVTESYVKTGDRASIFKRECSSPVGTVAIKRKNCWDSKVGEGKVVAVSNGSAKVQSDQPIVWTKDHFVKWSYPATAGH